MNWVWNEAFGVVLYTQSCFENKSSYFKDVYTPITTVWTRTTDVTYDEWWWQTSIEKKVSSLIDLHGTN
jgi:hypothetical protein